MRNSGCRNSKGTTRKPFAPLDASRCARGAIQKCWTPRNFFSEDRYSLCLRADFTTRNRRDLHLLRKIRNDFAHDFDHELVFANLAVGNRVKALSLPALIEDLPDFQESSPRYRFYVGVSLLFLVLSDLRIRTAKFTARAETNSIGQSPNYVAADGEERVVAGSIGRPGAAAILPVLGRVAAWKNCSLAAFPVCWAYPVTSGLFQPPGGDTRWSTSPGPQVLGSYSETGAAAFSTGSTMRQASST